MLYKYAKRELKRESISEQQAYRKYITYIFQNNELSMQETSTGELDNIKKKLKDNFYINKFLDQVYNKKDIDDADIFEEISENLS